MKIVLFSVFVVVLIIATARLAARRSRLDRAYSSDSSPLFEFRVRAKKKAWGGFGYVPLKSPTGVVLRIYSDSIRLDLAGIMEGQVAGGRIAIAIQGARMQMSRAGFPLATMRDCIALSGKELGRNVDIALYSEKDLANIWTALQQVGVESVSDGPSNIRKG